MNGRILFRLLLALFLGHALAAVCVVWASAAPDQPHAEPSQHPSSPVPPPAPPPFFWVDTTSISARSIAFPQPPLPDLSVQWIERTPRYHRYCVDYGRGLPELCAGTENDKRFPDPGEVVTFTAQIANQGVITSPEVAAIWTVGQPAYASPGWEFPVIVPSLAPGITTTLAITWPWPSSPLTVTLSLDPAGLLVETTRANNVRHHRTDALYLDVAVHPLIDEAFARRSNLVARGASPIGCRPRLTP